MTDLLYEMQRNLLIPMAEKYANEVANFKPPDDKKERAAWSIAWNRAFLGKMDELARAKRLIK